MDRRIAKKCLICGKEFFDVFTKGWLNWETWLELYTYLFAPIIGFILFVSGIVGWIQSYGKSNEWISILIGIFLLFSSYKLSKKDYFASK